MVSTGPSNVRMPVCQSHTDGYIYVYPGLSLLSVTTYLLYIDSTGRDPKLPYPEQTVSVRLCSSYPYEYDCMTASWTIEQISMT